MPDTKQEALEKSRRAIHEMLSSSRALHTKVTEQLRLAHSETLAAELFAALRSDSLAGARDRGSEQDNRLLELLGLRSTDALALVRRLVREAESESVGKLSRRHAYDSAAALARRFISSGQPLPGELRAFAVKVIDGEIRRPTLPPGKHHNENFLRDLIIRAAVERAAEIAGIYPTGRGGEKSGCEVVAHELFKLRVPGFVDDEDRAYKHIENIWNRRKR